jgi:hypothetical protein
LMSQRLPKSSRPNHVLSEQACACRWIVGHGRSETAAAAKNNNGSR